MRKVLILGGSHRDIPLIKAAQGLGYYVITLGNGSGYKGHVYSNQSYLINFNDLDAVRNVIQNENIQHLVPGCGEESYLNTVKLAHELKIGNFDQLKTAELIHNKWRFKEFCLQNNISTPKGIFYNKTLNLNSLTFPLVVKPTNLSGGRGVEVVQDIEELTTALDKATELSEEIFLEEFIKGELFAYSIILKDQKVFYSFSGKDDTYLNKYLITTAYPVTFSQKTKTKLDADITSLAQKLSMVDGMFHLQIIIRNNTPYIIDVTRRIPGDLYPYLIEYCDHINYSEAVVNAYLGKEVVIQKKKQEFVIRHVVMAKQNGTFIDIFIDDALKNMIVYKFDIIKSDTYIDNFLNTQVAILFVKMTEENTHLLDNINNFIYPIIR